MSGDQSSFSVVTLRGELDIGRRAEISQALQLDQGDGPILIDLSAVPYADSTVIAELLRFRNEATARDRRLALLIGSPQFGRVLQYAGLDQAFAVFDSRAAALTYLAGRKP